ncbi:class I SAM-dependent methyltransferase [Planctomycetota bacterium]
MTIRGAFYTFLIRKFSVIHYRHLLQCLPRGAHVLDVGIGNGLMLDTLWATIREREIRLEGIDVHEAYLAECDRRIEANGLYDLVSCRLVDVATYLETEATVPDHVYFSASFMLLSDQDRVLQLLRQRLSPEARVHFALTLYRQRSRFLEWAKPKLKYVTTIDFGPVTYRDDFFEKLILGGFHPVEEAQLEAVSGNNSIHFLSFRPHADVAVPTLQSEGSGQRCRLA